MIFYFILLYSNKKDKKKGNQFEIMIIWMNIIINLIILICIRYMNIWIW